MTTYLLITSDKPTELTASTDGKNWLPVVNAEECDIIVSLKDGLYLLTNGGGNRRIFLDTPVELEGWQPKIVYQIAHSTKPDSNFVTVSKSVHDKHVGFRQRQAYRLKRLEPVKPNNSPFDLLDLSPIEAKTQEEDPFKDAIWNRCDADCQGQCNHPNHCHEIKKRPIDSDQKAPIEKWLEKERNVLSNTAPLMWNQPVLQEKASAVAKAMNITLEYIDMLLCIDPKSCSNFTISLLWNSF